MVTAVSALTCTDGRDGSVNPNYATVTVTPTTPTTAVVQFVTIQYFWGICTFAYSVSDGNGGLSTARVTVNVNNGIYFSSPIILY